ncbi:hypothetical protein B0J12DRAFT_571658 [Macrophomina phaseolina]|uniref:RRM domain-containing protein n=1 Tax=Macrophomina phaseolina TaxID=35725 RepID=A0ABQ8GGN1_9PEZI|nr:hypothetical protein B0J12DRAFT_571658 [Macrophomina phaseolina]
MATTTAVEISKKEKKKDKNERKEKKEKKEKKTKTESESPAEVAPKSSKDSPSSSKKRKRSALPEDGELEVDITAPEPLSKREQRLAKKGKLDPNTKASKAPKPSTASSEPADSADSDKEDGAGKDSQPADKKQQKDKPKKEKSPHGIWIGNLPWTATRDTLRQFLADRAGIAEERITRIHMPPPDKAVAARMTIKPHNKGFAYVDFDGAGAVQAAIDASEALMGGRAVLIKDASNFEGRPQRPKEGEGGAEGGTQDALTKFSKTAATQLGGGKEPSKRVFVGNLSFATTKDDLIAHYSKCGEVADVHVATFQDTGKCKGYAWVTFEELDAAAAAVAGYTLIPIDDDSDEEMEDAENADGADKKKRKRKTRKWFVNRLEGRDLRVEYAEDASTRYKKRFGKERDAAAGGSGGEELGEVDSAKHQPRHKGKREPRKVDARSIKPGAALANAPRASGAIVEGTGKKITFD